MAERGAPQEFYFYRGRTALYALLRALDLKPGDEVLVQAYTCLAVVAPILGVGALPLYADITPQRFSFDPASVEAAISPRTRVMIVQHTFGIPADLDHLLAIARRHNLIVIEDCCHVSPSSDPGTTLGFLGAAAIYSYQWSKPLVIGRGGSARVNDPALGQRVAELYRSFGWPNWKDRTAINLQYVAFNLVRQRKIFDYLRRTIRAIAPSATGTIRRDELEGRITAEYNLRMAPTLQRRLAARLSNEPAAIARRHLLGARLHQHLLRLGVSCVDFPSVTNTVFLRYPILTRNREQVIQAGRERGLEVERYYLSPIDPLAEDDWPRVRYQRGSCPQAEALVEQTVTVPIQPWFTDQTWDKVLAFFDEMKARGLLLSRPANA